MTLPWFLTNWDILPNHHSSFLWNICPQSNSCSFELYLQRCLTSVTAANLIGRCAQQRSRSVTFSSQSHGALHCCRGNRGPALCWCLVTWQWLEVTSSQMQRCLDQHWPETCGKERRGCISKHDAWQACWMFA